MPSSHSPKHRVTDLRYQRATRQLSVTFDDGTVYHLAAELLRVESPSAEVQGHGAHQKQLVAGKRDVGLTAIEPVGSYAVRLIFDDHHDSGLFTWDYLRKLGENQNEMMARYEAALAERGLGRDGQAHH